MTHKTNNYSDTNYIPVNETIDSSLIPTLESNDVSVIIPRRLLHTITPYITIAGSEWHTDSLATHTDTALPTVNLHA